MPFCNMCGVPIADGAPTCPACASRATAPPQPPPQSPPIAAAPTDNSLGMLAYVTFIPAIVFLVLEPYNKNRFVRFHSFQCIFFTLAVVAAHIALSIVGSVPFMFFLTWPIHKLLNLALIAGWIFLGLKANQGQMYKLPTIGDIAEKQANAM